MDKATQRLVVILGAPGSGLASVTGILEFLGVRFRRDAAQGRPDEHLGDQEVDINDSLLVHLGSGRDRLAPAWSDVALGSAPGPLRVRAFHLLRTRLTQQDGIWGLNDSATSRLLGFWNKVFRSLDAEVSFVLAIRNPASVANSLAKRSAIPAEKAYFLWLQHVLPSILVTTGARRVVVDYDRLLADPVAQATRISAALGLPFPEAGALSTRGLNSSLLESGRRHERSTEASLIADSRASTLVGSTYRLLDLLATDQESVESLALRAEFKQINLQLTQASPAFAFINSLEDAHRHLLRIGAEREARMAKISHTLAYRTQALADRDSPLGQTANVRQNSEPISALHKVPPGFDPQLYLDLHPDLSGSLEEAATHYLKHGQYEGRGFALPEIDLLNEDGFKSGRQTILVVSHEASRTGAPLLTLGLVQASIDRYNVVALLLGEGPLVDAFKKAGAAVVISPRMRGNPTVTEVVIRRLHERFDFTFALVNSIESRAVLPALGQHYVPTVALLHEFAAYTRPATAFKDAFLWSSEVIFSTGVTLENAQAQWPGISQQSAHVLPQGRCLVPTDGLTEEQLRAERRRLRRLMRPKGVEDQAVIVLGAGTVHIRKGVDLFIQCAARAILIAPAIDFRFVWVGAGYDPLWDTAFSVYVADQIRRAGLEDRIVFIEESVAIETAYEEADLFLLSSRLDPLPNVAIESMAFGLPVLCFDKTGGIADFLNNAGFGKYCVAQFLDSADMAEKVSVLAASKTLRERVGSECRNAATTFFDANRYFTDLLAVADKARDRVRQEKEDAGLILESGVFRPDFAADPHVKHLTIPQSVRRHVRAWASGIDQRKPFPGFHPGVYRERHGLAMENADPLAEYLRAGRPGGAWDNPVISNDAEEERTPPTTARVVLHLHVHYPELLGDMTTRLSRNQILPDLLVSITDERARIRVIRELAKYRGKVVDVRLVPNRGRDIGPLLTAFGQKILSDYDYVGHIHTKKSATVKDAAMGATWYRFLLENLIGGDSGAMADRILAAMHEDPTIGLAFPDDPHVVGWGANRTIAEGLAARLGLGTLPEHWNFPVGTMFWARTEALAPLVGLAFDWEDYPEEPLPYDGTLLHAIERLLPLTLSRSQRRIATTNVFGCTR